jgi:hypothetical protein
VAAAAAAAEKSAADNTADGTAGDDAIVSLAAYNVKADRIEDFGLRIDSAPYPDAPGCSRAGHCGSPSSRH